MDTSFDTCLSMEDEGIFPRAITYLFERVEQKFSAIPNSEIIINAQFIELYKEEIIDLLESLSAGSIAHRQISQFNNPITTMVISFMNLIQLKQKSKYTKIRWYFH